MENVSQGDNTLAAFRQMKASGIDPYAQIEQGSQVDAAPTQEEPNETYAQEEADVQEPTEPQDTDDNADLSDDTDTPDDEPIVIPQEQQTAFQKALEREKRKAREAADKKFKEQYETEYSTKFDKHQKFFDQLGIDPETAMQAIEQNKIKQEAETLAYQNGWDEQQTQWYVKQQQQDKEMRDLRVSVQINDLADRADYPGIKQMKSQIAEFVSRNPNVTVDQAYHAVGGQPLFQQLKREMEQREIAKRQQTKRTVVTDAPATMTGPTPLPPEAVAFMKREGLSEAEVRDLMRDDFPKDLTTFRKQKNRR